uniref:TetR/AcrR family transcriptional regulator n=1 Tax=Mycobacteroides abscessus TaxID=36809 RepID=UPI0012FFF5ED
MTDPRLTLESIVGKAIEIADSDGLSGVSMRKIADALGVGAMSLYRHVADKDVNRPGFRSVLEARMEHDEPEVLSRDA